jgi:hypothetical protein
VDHELLVAGVEEVGPEDGVADGDRVYLLARGQVVYFYGVIVVRLDYDKLRVPAERDLAKCIGGAE